MAFGLKSFLRMASGLTPGLGPGVALLPSKLLRMAFGLIPGLWLGRGRFGAQAQLGWDFAAAAGEKKSAFVYSKTYYGAVKQWMFV